MLMNLATLDWDESMLSVFDIPRAMLPKIVACSDASAFGVTDRWHPHLRRVGDQQAALMGQACFDPGESKNTYGTGCFLLLNTGEKIVQSKRACSPRLLINAPVQDGDYALEGSIAVTGSLVQWLRDNLGIIHRSADIEPLAPASPIVAASISSPPSPAFRPILAFRCSRHDRRYVALHQQRPTSQGRPSKPPHFRPRRHRRHGNRLRRAASLPESRRRHERQ